MTRPDPATEAVSALKRHRERVTAHATAYGSAAYRHGKATRARRDAARRARGDAYLNLLESLDALIEAAER